MSLDRAKMLLEKIETLHRSISMDSDSVNRIERDLMLSYIRQLYEVYLDLQADQPIPKLQRSTPVVTVSPATTTAPPPPPPVEPPAPPPVAPPPVVAAPAEAYVPPPPPPQPEPVAPAPPPPVVEKTSPTTIPAGLNGLFEHKAAKELSEKLGQRPVSDLTKSMAINDRLLYANSLFQGDSRVMNNVLAELNGKRDFDDTLGVLVDLAKQYNWTQDEREEIAKSFIKLVRRRWS
jgi:hypothetical protein